MKITQLCRKNYDELTISPYGIRQNMYFIGLSDIECDDEIDSCIVVNMNELKEIYNKLGKFIEENECLSSN